MSNKLANILSGDDDEFLLQELFSRIQPPCSAAQALFVNAWELSQFIASDGFEILFEQERSLEEFAKTFEDIGFPEALPVFRKVKAVVPDSMHASDFELRAHLSGSFDRLKELFYEYLDVANDRLLPAFGDFIRKHRDEFAEHLR